MKYVNFGNDQTFHFYTFLTSSPGKFVEEMLAQAFDQAAASDMLELDGPTACVQQKIVELLEERVGDLAMDYGFGEGPGEDGGAIGDECDGSAESLLHPILWQAVHRLDYYAVAEALLRDYKKWAPERVRCEARRDEGADRGDGGAAVEC